MIVETGAYIRVRRNQKWESVLVERLTPEELRAIFEHRHPTELLSWIGLLCQTLRKAQAMLERAAAESFAEDG